MYGSFLANKVSVLEDAPLLAARRTFVCPETAEVTQLSIIMNAGELPRTSTRQNAITDQQNHIHTEKVYADKVRNLVAKWNKQFDKPCYNRRRPSDDTDPCSGILNNLGESCPKSEKELAYGEAPQSVASCRNPDHLRQSVGDA